MSARMTVAVIGGTGAEGRGLALRLAKAGYEVIVGSREAARAEAAAAELREALPRARTSGATYIEAATRADLVLMTVPYKAQHDTAKQIAPALAGKILVDATVPLAPPEVGRVQLPEGGPAAAQLQAALGGDIRVVAAFQNVSAHHLNALDHDVDCDVLICGDDLAACETVIGIADAIGLRGLYAGPICNSVAAEALTSILITINRRHKVAGAGIRITGL